MAVAYGKVYRDSFVKRLPPEPPSEDATWSDPAMRPSRRVEVKNG